VSAGQVLSLPVDPDASARAIRAALWASARVNVGVVITDTAGRAWRLGQTDLAIGCAGIAPLLDLQGSRDTHGNVLAVTAPALADELAAAADLVKGKVSGRPLAIVRGLGDFVLVPGDDGPGAAALIRDSGSDLFGLGARDAVVAAALRSDRVSLGHFPRRIASDPEPFAGLASGHDQVHVGVTTLEPGVGWGVQIDVRADADRAAWVEVGRLQERAETLAAAHRLTVSATPDGHSEVTGWRSESRTHWVVA
jgi:coenzyme F420-0:L-glutamate ligase/coenzyme F420-1:gamma-L-glutamate ligase